MPYPLYVSDSLKAATVFWTVMQDHYTCKRISYHVQVIGPNTHEPAVHGFCLLETASICYTVHHDKSIGSSSVSFTQGWVFFLSCCVEDVQNACLLREHKIVLLKAGACVSVTGVQITESKSQSNSMLAYFVSVLFHLNLQKCLTNSWDFSSHSGSFYNHFLLWILNWLAGLFFFCH